MSRARDIAVITTGRQDFGILRSTLVLLRTHPWLRTRLWVGGMHLAARFGSTIDMLAADGFGAARTFDFLTDPPRPAADAARFMAQLDAALDEDRPSAVLIVGDRSETLAAAFAATLRRVPILHLHGGEETEGAIDNALRHAITKLAHLHLVSHPVHARRVARMGERLDSIHVVGPPGVDNLLRSDLASRQELREFLRLDLPDPVVVVTVHPTTLAADSEVDEVIAAMRRVPATYIVTMPNADEGGADIRRRWVELAAALPNVAAVDALGERRYWGLLRIARAVLGNSSSAIIEAPAAGVPAVNVGDRQKGRLRTGAVLDVPPDAAQIAQALTRALESQAEYAGPETYPTPPAAPRIVRALESFDYDAGTRKVFSDVSADVPLAGLAT